MIVDRLTKSSHFLAVTPQNPGVHYYPSTRGIQVEVGLPDATLENRAESPLYGELYQNTKPAYHVPNSPIYAIYIQIWIKTASWAHATISIKHIATMNPTISNSSKSSNIYSYTIHTLNLKSSNTCIHHQSHTRLSSNSTSWTSRPLARSLYL